MRKSPLYLAMLLALLTVGFPSLASAESVASGFIDYSAKPLATDARVPSVQLKWLNQVFDLMGSSDFTFIYRIDSDHWMGLYRDKLAMVLHIHDGTAAFDFRARVDRQSGQLTLIKGVAWQGEDRGKSALTSAQRAIGYLGRVLENRDIFASGKAAAVGDAPASAKELQAMRSGSAAASESPVVTSVRKPAGSDDPLSRLMDGNRRYVDGMFKHPGQDAARRTEVASSQKPFAIVLTCSDSRLPPEILFDQGLGDLFVIRTAGEVAGDLEIGSIEYAAEHLGVTHLMILGHERCGAVKAAVDNVAKPSEFSEALARIIMQIQPAVVAAKGLTGEFLDNAVRQNILLVKKNVLRSPVVNDLVHEKNLTISTGYYDLDNGMVSLID